MSDSLADTLADLRRQPGVTRLRLTGLDLEGVTTFMEHTAGHDLEQPARQEPTDADEAIEKIIHGELGRHVDRADNHRPLLGGPDLDR